jgi:iron complex outermembrane receptor protein
MYAQRIFTLSPLVLAVLAALPAAAQQQPTAPAPERIEVTGYRAAIESALAEKRDENAMVDVVKADDIAKFPDTNLAEAMQRISGVTITREAGEGRNISVRGLGPGFTRVRINGIEAQASTGGTDATGGNNRTRGFDFNVFAAELFNQITVRKSQQADVDEGSLGATVDLSSARPFDFSGFKSAISAQTRYNDQAEKFDPRLSFLLSNTWNDGMFGVLLSGAYSKRHVLEEGFSTVRWDNGASSGGWCTPQGVTPANPAGSTATTCGPAAQAVARVPGTATNIAAFNAASDPNNFHPRLPRYGLLTHEQERTGVTFSLQARPWAGTVVSFDLLYSRIQGTRQEDFLEAISFSRSAAQGGKPQTSVVATGYDANGALLYGTYNGVDIRSEQRFDELDTKFQQPSLTLQHDLSPTLKLFAKLGQAKSEFRNPTQTTTTFDALNVNGYSIDFRCGDRLPCINYPFDVTQIGGPGQLTIVGVPVAASGTQPATIPNTTSSEIRIRPQGTDNTVDQFNLNLDWEAMRDFNVRGGLDYKKFDMETFEFRRVNQNDTIFAPPAGTTLASLSGMVSGIGRGFGMPSGTPSTWIAPNLSAIASAYNIYCNCIVSGPAGGPGDFTLSSITNGNARGNNFSVSEKDTGGFLMADFRTAAWGLPMRGNFGVRYVETKTNSVGYQAAGGGTQVTVDNKYDDWLPSANLVIDVQKDVLLRLAAAKVMSRPILANLSPGGSITTTGNLAITVGNPFLEPFRAKTFDAGLEWYFGKGGFIGVGYFYKDIDTYIQQLRQSMPYSQTGLPLSLLPSNFTGDEVFAVTTPINTKGGPLKGWEVNYQQPFTFLPGWGRNFGTLLNYTSVKSTIEYLVSPTATATITDDLIGLSPKSWNATLYYDDGRFHARVSAAYRAAYLTRVPGQNNNDVEGTSESTNVDASISYKITPNFEIVLEGVNLTNEPVDQFISRARNSVVSSTYTGREYLVGIRAKF